MHDSYLASQKTDINENGSDIAQTNVNFTEMANDTIRPIVNVDSACVKILIGNPIAYTEPKVMRKAMRNIAFKISKNYNRKIVFLPFANYLHRQTA